MKKAIVSNELKKRLEFCAKNGSVIATDILNELKKSHKDCFGNKTVDYFDSLRSVGNCSEYKTLSIKVTACAKDLNNPNFPDKGNPRAPYFKENREKMSLGTFIGLFANIGGYTSEECNFFEGAMCVPDKVTYRISSKMEDFERAYNESNYFPFSIGNATLHNSCMRYEDKARNVADFYANFAGAKILIAEDSQGQILGRAIVWDNVIIPNISDEAKVLDRIYYTFDFIRQGIIDHARKNGIHIRKNKNSVGTQMEFYVYDEFNSVEHTGIQYWSAYVKVPQTKWHKKGAPYMDTFCKLSKYNDGLILANDLRGIVLADLVSTGGFGCRLRMICPNCGEVHREGGLCLSCNNELIEETPFGSIIKSKTRTYKGKKYPISFFKDGKPSIHFLNYIGLQRICDPYCEF